MTRRGPIRVVDLAGSPHDIGFEHGRRFAPAIRDYLDERLGLLASGAWSGRGLPRDEAVALAAACLPAHESYSPALYEELVGLAAGAGITPAEAVIVGGFTDFVDLVRGHGGEPASLPPAEDDCTAFIVPDVRSAGGALIGQTWDMHDTATDHVALIRVRADDAPAAAVFTTYGCVGQLGMNEHGVAVAINNLSAATGRIGVTWPFVVREILAARSAAEALERVQAADVCGGHSYLVLDRSGDGWCVEAMPGGHAVTTLADTAIVHTNHTLHDVTTGLQAQRNPALQASSEERLSVAASHLDRDGITADDLMALTRVDGVICVRPAPPIHIETSGAAVMDPAAGALWAVWGAPTDNDYVPVDVVAPTPTRR